MKYNGTASPEQDHLSVLYAHWTQDKQAFGAEMVEAIDKIIHKVLRKYPTEPYYRRTEEKADLMNDMRLLCLRKLERIKDPTNKRIFNYLRISVDLALKDKSRRVGKQRDREGVEREHLGEQIHSPLITMSFGSPVADEVAYWLGHGETKQSIRTRMGLTRGQLEDIIGIIKENLQDTI